MQESLLLAAWVLFEAPLVRVTRERKEAKREEFEKMCRPREKMAGAQEQIIVIEISTMLEIIRLPNLEKGEDRGDDEHGYEYDGSSPE